MKYVMFFGFTPVQLEIARKFQAFHKHTEAYQIVVEGEVPFARVCMAVLNCNDVGAVAYCARFTREHPVPVLGTGNAPSAGVVDFHKGAYTPFTALKMMEMLNRPVTSSTAASAESDTGPSTVIPSVLVVDDSMSVRSTMKAKLASYGYDVDIAIHGEDGLHKLKSGDYQLVFLDVMMPGIDGFEVCRRIKKSGEYKAVPVYMLTSKDGMFDKVRGALSGCDGYLVKPLEPERLREVLKKHLPIDLSVSVPQ